MNVHQLSIAYVPEQDRILVRVNTKQGQELSVWFTRRLTLGLMPLMDRAVTEHVARHSGPATSHLAAMDELSKKAMTQFKRSENLKTSDFATPYKTAATSVQVFEQPLLVTEVNVAPLPSGQLRLSFTEKLSGTKEQRSFQLALSDQLIHAFVHLLERAVQQSQWRDIATVAAPATATDPSPDPERPHYLN
jgi:hypothetical protein